MLSAMFLKPSRVVHRIPSLILFMECVFARLFAPEVERIRNENHQCNCLKLTQAYSATLILDYGISELVKWSRHQLPELAACLSFEDFLRVSECSHCGLNIGIERGRPSHMLEFLRICPTKKKRWQRVKTKMNLLGEPWIPGNDPMKHRKIFWEKLRFQLHAHVSRLHSLPVETSLRRHTVQELLCHMGIPDGHKHLSSITDANTLLQLEIPERRYWEHWHELGSDVMGYLEPSECNVVLGILAFTLYIVRICDTCTEALETEGYRIHSEFGVQRRILDWWIARAN